MDERSEFIFQVIFQVSSCDCSTVRLRKRSATLASLGRRAAAITDALNKLPGMHCVDAGSLYAFPSITLPPAAIAAAKVSALAL